MQDRLLCEAYSDNTTMLWYCGLILNFCPLSDYFVSKIGTCSCCSLFMMLYAVQMLFLGLALLIAARPGLDNPGCYRDGLDFFRGICEGMALVLFLGELFITIFILFTYVVACICSIYSCMSYVGALYQYVRIYILQKFYIPVQV